MKDIVYLKSQVSISSPSNHMAPWDTQSRHKIEFSFVTFPFLWLVVFLIVHQAFPGLPGFLAQYSCAVHLLRLEIKLSFSALLESIKQSENAGLR